MLDDEENLKTLKFKLTNLKLKKKNILKFETSDAGNKQLV